MAVWTQAYVNRLPDTAFFYVGPGGVQDEYGRTHPLSLRKLPYRDDRGRIDEAHLRNALSRLSQAYIPKAEMPRIRARAQRMLAMLGGYQRGLPREIARPARAAPRRERRVTLQEFQSPATTAFRRAFHIK